MKGFQDEKRLYGSSACRLYTIFNNFCLFGGGVSDNLFENNEWITNKTINVNAYDSGTDSGPTFVSPDDPTIPRVPVFEITTPPLAVNNVVAPMGSITITRIDN